MHLARKLTYRPWLPVSVRPDNQQPKNSLEIRKADAVAIQAFAKGVANEEQQQRAWAAILHITEFNDLEFLPEEHGGERDSAFKGGKRHIGLQLLKIASNPLNLLTGEKNERRASSDGHASRTSKSTTNK